ncbi:LysR family transcriptional regulator [Thalassospira lucentensis]|uniref:LysR family transcriptional regulator n=1 Tax=Thalassospira lucentensis TaxID=168935 RepID=UPI00142DF773|nr:LysR family transcriptional regulator [Thalassospira lucentensis]NIZ00042.1 LysR family transcriptional regulator [Thalassospira lucentensis]
MDWDKLRVFHAVAEAGSFTHAGENLNLSQSAVSRQISALEESVKVPLFHRHARGLILTEQGELLYRTAHDVFAKLSMAEARIRESKERPSGPLKVTTTVAFGSTWLTPRINEFLERYPEIELSLVLNDEELDLAMREADVAIRMQPPRQADLVQRQLMTLRYHVFASPEYIKQYGMPKTPEELKDHRLIIYGADARPPVSNVNWMMATAQQFKPDMRPILKLNNIYGIFRATESGLGISALPDYLLPTTSNLVRILPELEGPSFDAYFVYPEELRHSKRIAVFRDFLIEEINKVKAKAAASASSAVPTS